MPVKIRLTRMGKKKQPSYRVVVVDSRRPRDGAYIEQIGRYDPLQEPSLIEIDNDKALAWLSKGAQPTDRAKKLLEISGAWTQYRIARGDIHTIDAAPAPATAEPASTEPAAHIPVVHVVGGDEPAEAVAEELVEEAVAEAVVEELVEEAVAEAVVEELVEEAVAEAVVEELVEEAVAEDATGEVTP